MGEPVSGQASEVTGVDGSVLVEIGGGVGVGTAPRSREQGEVGEADGGDPVEVGAVAVAKVACPVGVGVALIGVVLGRAVVDAVGDSVAVGVDVSYNGNRKPAPTVGAVLNLDGAGLVGDPRVDDVVSQLDAVPGELPPAPDVGDEHCHRP